MWHGGLHLVQSCKMWCAVCTLPCSHKSEPHRPINFMLAANRPTPVLRRLSWTQAFLERSQPGGCGPNARMKDWRVAGTDVVGSPPIDSNSTKERWGFLERRRLGEGFRCRVSCRRCFGLRALVQSLKYEALRLVSDGVMPDRMGKEEGVLRRQPVITRIDSFKGTSMSFVWALRHHTGAQ